MNYSKIFRKALYLTTTVLTLVMLAEINQQLPVLSQVEHPTVSNSDNLFCYMQTEDSQIVSLENLCKAKKQPIEPLSSKDRQFIEDYKKLLRGYPKAQATLSRIVEQNPQAIVRKATELCHELKNGEISDSRIDNPDVDADILNSLAPEYYCRQFDD